MTDGWAGGVGGGGGGEGRDQGVEVLLEHHSFYSISAEGQLISLPATTEVEETNSVPVEVFLGWNHGRETLQGNGVSIVEANPWKRD